MLKMQKKRAYWGYFGEEIQIDKQMSEKKIDFDTLEIDIKKLPLKVCGSIKKEKKSKNRVFKLKRC